MHISWSGRVQDITVVDKQITSLFGHGHVFIVDGLRVEIPGKQGKSFIVYYNSTYADLKYTLTSDIPRYKEVLESDVKQFAGFLPFRRKGQVKYVYPDKKHYRSLDESFIDTCGTLIRALLSYKVESRLFGVIPVEKNYYDFAETIVNDSFPEDKSFTSLVIKSEGCTFKLYRVQGSSLLKCQLMAVDENKFVDAEVSETFSLTTGSQNVVRKFELSSSVQSGVDYANYDTMDLIEHSEIVMFLDAMKCSYSFQYYQHAKAAMGEPIKEEPFEIIEPYNAYIVRHGTHVYRFIIVFKDDIKKRIKASPDIGTFMSYCSMENLAKVPGEYAEIEISWPEGFFYIPGEPNLDFKDENFSPYSFIVIS